MTPRAQRAGFIVLCGLGISGMLFAAPANYYWQPIDLPWKPMVAIGLPLCCLGALIVASRGETPRARGKRFLVALGVGAPFATLFLFGHLCAWNAWLDDSPPIEHRVDVLEAGRKARGQRRLEVPSWRAPGEREVLWISIDFDDAPTLIVTTRAGFLGYEWMDDVRVP